MSAIGLIAGLPGVAHSLGIAIESVTTTGTGGGTFTPPFSTIVVEEGETLMVTLSLENFTQETVNGLGLAVCGAGLLDVVADDALEFVSALTPPAVFSVQSLPGPPAIAIGGIDNAMVPTDETIATDKCVTWFGAMSLTGANGDGLGDVGGDGGRVEDGSPHYEIQFSTRTPVGNSQAVYDLGLTFGVGGPAEAFAVGPTGAILPFDNATLPVQVLADPQPPYWGLRFARQDEGLEGATTRMIGWQFTVGAEPIRVNALGFHDFAQDGLLWSHEVGIWRLSDEELLASAVVPAGTAGELANFFRFVNLEGFVMLLPGKTYVIAGLDEPQGSGVNDPRVHETVLEGSEGKEVLGFRVDGAITLGPEASGRMQSVPTGSFQFPATTVADVGAPGDTRKALLGPNMKFTPLPEPGFGIGAFSGLLALFAFRRRAAVTHRI